MTKPFRSLADSTKQGPDLRLLPKSIDPITRDRKLRRQPGDDVKKSRVGGRRVAKRKEKLDDERRMRRRQTTQAWFESVFENNKQRLKIT